MKAITSVIKQFKLVVKTEINRNRNISMKRVYNSLMEHRNIKYFNLEHINLEQLINFIKYKTNGNELPTEYFNLGNILIYFENENIPITFYLNATNEYNRIEEYNVSAFHLIQESNHEFILSYLYQSKRIKGHKLGHTILNIKENDNFFNDNSTLDKLDTRISEIIYSFIMLINEYASQERDSLNDIIKYNDSTLFNEKITEFFKEENKKFLDKIIDENKVKDGSIDLNDSISLLNQNNNEDIDIPVAF